MEVTPEMVDRIAHLARLSFDEAEREEIRADLEKMIGFVDRLREPDLEFVETPIQPDANGNAKREDISEASLFPGEALREAPAHSGPFFTVPKVIRKD